MSNQLAPTMNETDEGILPFQTWFVKERWQPVAKNLLLPADVRASMPVMQALERADIVIIAPSNPFVSVQPILNVYPIESMIMDLPKAVVAVTPIIGDAAVKGPAAKMMQEMGLPVSATAVAQHYGELIDGFVYDEQDGDTFAVADMASLGVDTIMKNADDRLRLAQDVLRFAQELI
jgi:LPPG:FO 2-phospho-L-lactate transferase